MPDTIILTKTKTRVKVGVATAGIMLAMAAGAMGGANYMIGRGLVLMNDFFQVRTNLTPATYDAKLLSVNVSFSDEPFFLAAEPVNLSQIKVAFVGSGVSGDSLQAMVKDLSLYYHRVSGAGYGYSYGYGYGYDDTALRFLGFVPQTEKVGSENIVIATFALPPSPVVRIYPGNVYNFELHGNIPADAPSGQFMVLINDVVGWGYQTGKYVRVVRNNSQGQIMAISAPVKKPVYSPQPTGSLVRGRSYDFSARITGAMPNAPILFFLQRPDGSMKYNGVDPFESSISGRNFRINPGIFAPNAITDADGNFSNPSASANVLIIDNGQNGTWTSWVTVGGIVSNKVTHIVTAAAQTFGSLGDVNGDGKIDSGDATLVNQYAQGAKTLSAAQLTAADVNKDGKVTANDAKIILQYSVGRYGSLPVNVKVGDVNKDGTVDSGDSVLIKQYLGSQRVLDAIQEAAADVNNDNQITQIDVDTILSYSVANITALPIPYRATTSTPSITVLTPNGGEQWEQGKTYQVKWQSKGVTTADIVLTSENGQYSQNTGGALGNSVSGSGSYDFKVPENFPLGNAKLSVKDRNNSSSFGMLPNGYIKIAAPSVLLNIYNRDTSLPSVYIGPTLAQKTPKCSCDLSSEAGNISGDCWNKSIPTADPIGSVCYDTYFDKEYPPAYRAWAYKAVIASSTMPSITVVSPNGGEKWEVGKQYTIQWRAVGLDKVVINLINYTPTSASQYNVALNVPASQGSYSWMAQSIQPGSNYKIVVGYGPVNDFSDAPFSIVAPSDLAGQNKYTFDQAQYGFYFPPCACDKDARNKDCSLDGFVTGDPVGSVCYDRRVSFYNRYVSDKYVVRGPMVKVSVDQTGLPETVIKGTTGVTLAKYVFDAKDSSEDVKINSAELTYKAIPDAAAANLSSCQLFDGGTPLNSGANTVNVAHSITNPQKIKFILDNGLIVPKGVSKTASLKCNLSASAVDGSLHSWGIDSTSSVSASGTVSNSSVVPIIFVSAGKQIKVIAGGSYTVSLDPSTPQSRLVAAGTTKNTMTVLKFFAKDEAIAVSKIRLGLTNPNSSGNDLSQVYIYDGATLLGQSVLGIGNAQGGTAQAQTTFTLATPLQIPANGNKIVTIKADIAPITTVNSVAKAGDAIAIDFIGSADPTKNIGVGQGSGQQITTDSPATQQAPIYIFRSVPTVSAVPLPTTTLTNGTMVISKFKVAADAKGDIDYGKASFRVTTVGVKVDNFSLYDVTEAAEKEVVPSAAAQITNDIVQMNDSIPHMIAAGAYKIFELRGTVTGVKSGSVVTTRLLGDSQDLFGQTNSKFSYGGNFGNFVWSDVSQPSHSVSSSDWHNGYLVNGLPASGLGPQTVSK